MKTKLRFLSLLIALVMCFSVLASCAKNDGTDGDEGNETNTEQSGTAENKKIDPTKDPVGAIKKAVSMLGGTYGPNTKDLTTLVEKISAGTAEYNIGFEYDGVSASADIVSNSKDKNLSGSVNVGYDNISTTADIWYNDDLVIKAPALFGDEAYGIQLSTLREDLDNSPFILEGMGYDSADEFFEDVNTSITENGGPSIDELTQIFKLISGDSVNTAAGEEFGKKLEKIVKNMDIKVTEDKLDNKDAYKLTFTFTKNNLIDISDAYLDVIEAMYGDIYEFANIDFDEMKDSVNSVLDEMEFIDTPCDFYLDKKTGELRLIGFSYETTDDNYTTTSSLKAEFTKEAIVITLADESSSEDYTSNSVLEITYKKVNKTDNTGFTIKVSSSGDYDDLEDNVYDYDYENDTTISFIREKNGEFDLTVTTASDDYEEETVISGTLKYDSKSFEFSLDSIKSYGEKIHFDFNFSIKAGGKVESVPKYKNIVTMSEGDWTELTSELGSSAVLAELADIFSEMGSDDNYYDDEYYDDEYYDDEYYDDENYFDDEYYFDDETYFDDEYYFDDETYFDDGYYYDDDLTFEDYYDEGLDYYYDNMYEY